MGNIFEKIAKSKQAEIDKKKAEEKEFEEQIKEKRKNYKPMELTEEERQKRWEERFCTPIEELEVITPDGRHLTGDALIAYLNGDDEEEKD